MEEKTYKKNIIGWEEVLESPPSSYLKWFGNEKEFFIKHIKKDSKVLEVGCGDGRSLKDLIGITKNIFGIDHDKTAIEHAKSQLKDYPYIKLIIADGNNLPFEDNSFDCVTCIGTFCNFGEEKYEILNEMKRVLRKDGCIIISVYSEKALPERLKVYNKIAEGNIKEVKDNGTIIFDDGDEEGISEQFSKEQLKSILEKVNLKLIEIKDSGIGYICGVTK